tara:strand:+ start:202 stop:1056 length:855 start_codon:yes stop_codon:yes gene_type:complete
MIRLPATIRYENRDYSVGSEPIEIDNASLTGDVLDNPLAVLMLKYIVSPFTVKNYSSISKNMKHYLNSALLEDATDENPDMKFNRIEYENYIQKAWESIMDLTAEEFFTKTRVFVNTSGTDDRFDAILRDLDDTRKDMKMEGLLDKLGYEWLTTAHKMKDEKGTELYSAGESVRPYGKALTEAGKKFQPEDSLEGTIHQRKAGKMNEEQIAAKIKEGWNKYLVVSVDDYDIDENRKNRRIVITVNFDEIIADLMAEQGIQMPYEKLVGDMDLEEWYRLFEEADG